MAETTTIEWADKTWSPWEGCTKISPACDNCYAEAMNRWLRGGENWGPGAPRREYSSAHWRKPFAWHTQAMMDGTRPKVFPSVMDPFDNEIITERRLQFLRVVMHTPQLTWLLLTKRIGNVKRQLLESADLARTLPAEHDLANWLATWMDGGPPANVWLGITIANREEMLRDAPKLKAAPATLTFWSYEPALGPLGVIPRELMPEWVICGGESGRNARPMSPDWVRQLRDQCDSAGVRFHFKQWGEWLPMLGQAEGVRVTKKTTTADGWVMGRAGKKAAGRTLDGTEHKEFPHTPACAP